MYLRNFIYGLIIGIGFIIPGVSGGVIATILGIYEIVLNKLNNLFNNFKENILYLLPLVGGILISVLIFSKLILFFLSNNLNFISYVFIGLILGCIPYLLKEIKNKSNNNISIIYFLIAILLGVFLFIIQKNNLSSQTNPNIFIMFLAGIIYACGKIIPGISGAALLMLLGVYEYFLNIIANPFNISFNTIISFIPFIISFLLSSIFIIKLINYLLKNYFRNTYSAIIGFIISSTLFIYPNNITYINVFTALISFNIAYILCK